MGKHKHTQKKKSDTFSDKQAWVETKNTHREKKTQSPTHTQIYIHTHTHEPTKVRHTSTHTVPHTGKERYKEGKNTYKHRYSHTNLSKQANTHSETQEWRERQKDIE